MDWCYIHPKIWSSRGIMIVTLSDVCCTVWQPRPTWWRRKRNLSWKLLRRKFTGSSSSSLYYVYYHRNFFQHHHVSDDCDDQAMFSANPTKLSFDQDWLGVQAALSEQPQVMMMMMIMIIIVMVIMKILMVITITIGSVDNWSCSNYEPVLHTALRWANTSHFSQKTAS